MSKVQSFMISKRPSLFVYKALLPPPEGEPSHTMRKWSEELYIEYSEDCFHKTLLQNYIHLQFLLKYAVFNSGSNTESLVYTQNSTGGDSREQPEYLLLN